MNFTKREPLLISSHIKDSFSPDSVITLAFSIFFFRFRNAMLKSICEVLDLERSGVNSELVKRILNFLMHPKPSGKVRINFYYFSNKSILFSLSFLSFFLMNILIVSSIAVNIQ